MPSTGHNGWARCALPARGVTLAVVLACMPGCHPWRAPVRAEAVGEFLNKAAGAGKVQFSEVRISLKRMGEDDLQVAVSATARTLGPLYSKVDTAGYLRAKLNLDPEST